MITGVVLAAGRGERFRAPKLLHAVAGKPLVGHTVGNCLDSSLDAVVVVVGPPGGDVEEAIRAAFPDQRLSFAYNEAPERGQMSSLKTGLHAIPAAATAAGIFLGDMPLVSAGIIDCLLDAHRRGGRLVVPVCEGQWRHPRIIPATQFADFLALEDDDKGSGVIERYAAEVVEVNVGEVWNFLDVDTSQDFARVKAILGA
ncbi:MAG: NTP transferase domain-containing protein [Candidatus Krumholzibacteria bacterium]|nr:NTP transferase domain-containing protein [Candidatus Krumholzibacteria bacterium]